jgi:MFS family permease
VDEGSTSRRGPLAILAPERLGREFRWLWASSTVTNLGDGVLLSAAPLLVASLTREPFAVALAVFLQQLPWIILGIPAGALVDRLDRRRLMIVVNLLRAVVLGIVTATIATDTVSLPIVFLASFLLVTAETFTDNASSALLATRVPKAHLGLANARLTGTRVLTNQLAGPPLGAFLFGLGMWIPFGVDAVCTALGAVLVLRLLPSPAPTAPQEPSHIRQEMAEGIRWLWRHPPVRALALTIFFFNVTYGATTGVYVLYATERLGLDPIGYGWLITAMAVGGLIGSGIYTRLERRFALATLFRVGLAYETLTHLIQAVTTSAVVVAVVLVLFGIHAVVWGTTSTTVRQRAVPAALLGRVTSVYFLASIGGWAGGALIGGAVAQQFGLVAPFWFAFIGSAVILVLIWRTLDDIAHAPAADEGEGLAVASA